MEAIFPFLMEFLFTNQVASIEAIVLFLCLGLIALMFAHDAYQFLKKIFYLFHPRKAYVTENPISPEESLAENLLPEEKRIEVYPDIEIQSEIPRNSSVDDLVWWEKEETTPEQEKDLSETIEVVSPFLDEPLITTNEIAISHDTSIEEIIENTQPLSEISNEELPQETHIIDIIEEMEEEKMDDDTDFIGHTTSDTPPEGLLSSWDWVIEEKTTPTINESEIQKEIPTSHSSFSERSSDSPIPPEKRDKIVEIVSMVQTLIARGQLEEARAFIVSGLALDKDHRELNLLMASLYERDHAYTKAEYIFKDLAKLYPDDLEILEHLATSLAMQRRYEVAYELYKKVLDLGGESEEILYTLSHLASELSIPEDIYTYAKSYLRQYPRNPEILWLYTQALISRGERKEAVETLIKLKNLTPYNQEIVDLIGKLVTEEELAGNFGGEK